MRFPITALVVLIGLISVPSAHAQATGPSCDGDLALIRVSQLKPTGSLQGFMKAQEAHLAWYRKRGHKDNEIYSARVIVRDDTSKSFRYSDTEIMTFHVRPPGEMTTDAEWDAYVKMYRDNSDIKSEHMVCLPKKR